MTFTLLSVQEDTFPCLLHTNNLCTPVPGVSSTAAQWWTFCSDGILLSAVRWTFRLMPIRFDGRATTDWQTRWKQLRAANMCLWDLGVPSLRLVSDSWSNSLIVGINPAASKLRHVLMPLLYNRYLLPTYSCISAHLPKVQLTKSLASVAAAGHLPPPPATDISLNHNFQTIFQISVILAGLMELSYRLTNTILIDFRRDLDFDFSRSDTNCLNVI